VRTVGISFAVLPRIAESSAFRYSHLMSEHCWRCFRPLKSCYCGSIVPIRTGIKFIFLMHPKEAYKQKTGTGRLASLSLEDSEILVGVDFTENRRVNELIGDSAYFPVVLYPGPRAFHSDDSAFRDGAGGKILLVFIVDSTWALSKQIMNRSLNLHPLPTLSFRGSYLSDFRIKHQPKPYCLSTIESVYYLVRELQEGGMMDASVDPEGLKTVFAKMVEYQLSCISGARH
jgi:DTW domain-containing protein